MVGLKKKKVTYASISPKTVNPKDLAGNAEEEEEGCHRKMHTSLGHHADAVVKQLCCDGEKNLNKKT